MEMKEFLSYTSEDCERDGISYSVSEYSQKLCVDGKFVGAIIFEDRQIKINEVIIEQETDINLKNYYKIVNNTKSLYLRKIIFNEDDKYIGMLEDLFDNCVNHLPKWSLIWTQPNVWDVNNYTSQLNFTKPMYPLPNKNIMFFSNCV